MYQAIGKQQSYFSWDRNGEFYQLSPSQAKIALEITGIKRANYGRDLYKTWSL
jgi:hypothetical protein